MMLQYRINSASLCPRKDVIEAMDIYCKTVDEGSLTDTNQIKDYIWNAKRHCNEERIMFFYILYDDEDKVCGFSEFAYLPKNRVLFLDYLCTDKRNHVLFYLFYNMVLNEITTELKKKALFIRYIITELSTSQVNGVLSDKDSNYFRHLLTIEGFQLSKYPYYQPPLDQNDEAKEFNLAIKLVSAGMSSDLILDKKLYLSLVSEIYFYHYLAWFKNYSVRKESIRSLIQGLYNSVENEMPNNSSLESILLINCRLFDEGQCPKYNAQNITLGREKKRKRYKTITIIAWAFFTILTFVLFIIDYKDVLASKISAFVSILAGAISIVSFRRELFRTKH